MKIEEIKKDAENEHIPIMLDGGLQFLLGFIKEKDLKDILELGTAVGYSAINMALLDKAIHVDTIEKDKERYLKAKENIQKARLESQITAYYGVIEEFAINKKYDLIFVDAAKAQYQRYMERFLDNLKMTGYMIFDNMNFHGMVKDPSLTHNRNTKMLVKKIASFQHFVQEDERFDIILKEDIGDGILILRRKK